MILAKNKQDGTLLTFDSLWLFETANKISDNSWQISNESYEKKVIQEVEVQIIEPKPMDTAEFSFSEFNELLDTWTREDLELFAKDSRSSLASLAKKQLKKLK